MYAVTLPYCIWNILLIIYSSRYHVSRKYKSLFDLTEPPNAQVVPETPFDDPTMEDEEDVSVTSESTTAPERGQDVMTT